MISLFTGGTMKKIMAASVFLIFGMVFAVQAGFSPKKVACEAACKKTLESCNEKAAGNAVKKAACQASYNKCMDDCAKENLGRRDFYPGMGSSFRCFRTFLMSSHTCRRRRTFVPSVPEHVAGMIRGP
jgi:hypothetical protein